MKRSEYTSWSLQPLHPNNGVITDINFLETWMESNASESIITFGNGRSYGDVCLNAGGLLFDSRNLKNIVFDEISGKLISSAGVTIKEILERTMPLGWMLPVVPGTKEVTLGGAIANDVHGKNHHVMGSFGNHVESFTLLTTSRKLITCTESQNSDLFEATIGGLGLTGLITEVTIQLMKVDSPYMAIKNVPFGSISEFIELSSKHEEDFLYSVGWLNISKKLGSGILQLANHMESSGDLYKYRNFKQIHLPRFFKMPGLVNKVTVSMINYLYETFNSKNSDIKYFDDFLFPLDKLDSWNRVFFGKGLLQYQFLIPMEKASIVLNKILEIASLSGSLSFLNVIKTFGDKSSVGIMSFPTKGVTMSLDFFRIDAELLGLLDRMDEIIFNAGGKLYPAKDFRMDSRYFDSNFPRYQDFVPFIDPMFSSSYWRRVNNG